MTQYNRTRHREIQAQFAFYQQEEQRLTGEIARLEEQLNQQKHQSQLERMQCYEAACREMEVIEQTPPPSSFWQDHRLREIGSQRALTVAEEHLQVRHRTLMCWPVVLIGLAVLLSIVVGQLAPVSIVLLVAGMLLFLRIERTNAAIRAQARQEHHQMLLRALNKRLSCGREANSARETQGERTIRQLLEECQRTLRATQRRIGELHALLAVYDETASRQSDNAKRAPQPSKGEKTSSPPQKGKNTSQPQRKRPASPVIAFPRRPRSRRA